MKIKELMNATQRELNQLSEADLRSAFSNAKRSYSARAKSFEKLGVKQTVPQKFMNAIQKETSELSRNELLNAVLAARGNLSSSLATARGKLAFEQSRKNALKERLGLSEMSDSQFDRFGKFMGEMQQRYKETWKQVSFAAWKIATEAVQRNLDPDQFIDNFEYWSDHLEDLEDTMDAMIAGDDLYDSETMDEYIPDDYMPEAPAAHSRSAGRTSGSKHRSGRKAAEARRSRSRKGRRR